MTFNGWLQIALYCAIIIALVKPVGGYMTRLFAGERTLLAPVLGPIERGLYRLAGIDPNEISTGRTTRSPCCCSISRASCCCTCCNGYKVCCR